ncbi:hypothetical protein JCM21900_001478 [Sporobolomyces salmonicolor]
MDYGSQDDERSKQPAIEKVRQFEIAGLDGLGDDEVPDILYRCAPSLVGGKTNIFAYAPSSMTLTRCTIGTPPSQVPGTVSLQFDQASRDALVNGGSFVLEIYEPSAWLSKF